MGRTNKVAVRVAWSETTVTILFASAAFAIAALILSGSAFAVSEKVKSACKSDYYRHCKAYMVGTPQLRTCMTQAGKRKQLSSRCLRALINNGEVPRKYMKYL